MHTTLQIHSQRNTYQVSLFKTLESLLDDLSQIKNSLTVVDREIEKAYPDLIKQLQSFTTLLIIEATEDTKTLAGSELVLQFLQQHNATKSTNLIAIGGGITQDIASFAAHVYYRGIPFIFVPTTLLAMSDSCIGGKCGLNYFGFKNQIGAFHSPEKVLIWSGFTKTLTDDAIYSGYGEIFKLMLIGNEDDYISLCRTLIQDGFRNPSLDEYIFKALEIKKRFIEEDEFDVGVRRILNYGHTFGHAIELATHYQVPHGIAVVYGLDIANYIAYRMGFLSKDLYLTVHQFIESHFPKFNYESLSIDMLIEYVKRDKKISNGKVSMIFLQEIGNLKIEPVLMGNSLSDKLNDYFCNDRATPKETSQ